MSDIVFCRTWYKVEPEKFYNPVVTFDRLIKLIQKVCSKEEKYRMRLMKTTWEMRKENQVSIPLNKDSEYKEIDRIPKAFKPLVLPKVNI